jgi:hypothetical protein
MCYRRLRSIQTGRRFWSLWKRRYRRRVPLIPRRHWSWFYIGLYSRTLFLLIYSKTKTLDIKVEEVLQIGEKIKSSGNFYFKKEDFVNANRKYKKALRYLNKLHESDMSDEIEKRILSLELPCLLNRYYVLKN